MFRPLLRHENETTGSLVHLSRLRAACKYSDPIMSSVTWSLRFSAGLSTLIQLLVSETVSLLGRFIRHRDSTPRDRRSFYRTIVRHIERTFGEQNTRLSRPENTQPLLRGPVWRS